MSHERTVARKHSPRGRQFGQGQPRATGRPKGAIGEKTIVQKIAGELHDVTQNRTSKRVSTYELLLITMRGLAMAGDLRASKWMTQYCLKTMPENDGNYGYLVVPETMSAEMWIEQARKHNETATNPELWDDPLTRIVEEMNN